MTGIDEKTLEMCKQTRQQAQPFSTDRNFLADGKQRYRSTREWPAIVIYPRYVVMNEANGAQLCNGRRLLRRNADDSLLYVHLEINGTKMRNTMALLHVNILLDYSC